MITPNATQEGAGRMTLAQLKYVVTVAKAGTMTEAAKELFISQPSLTKSIKELEKEMHVRIFERTNKGIVVSKGMKCGDIDARREYAYCFTISDKARAVGGGVLEAILRGRKQIAENRNREFDA